MSQVTAQQHDLTASLQAATLTDSTNNNDANTAVGSSSSCIVPHPQSLPKSLTRSYVVGGVVTDITVQLFQERTVVTCSQLQGRIGHWLLCKATPSDPLNPAKFEWDISHLLGGARDDPLLAVYGKRVTDRILQSTVGAAAANAGNSNDPHPPPAVLLGLALGVTGKDPAVFHTIVDLLVKVYLETTMR